MLNMFENKITIQFDNKTKKTFNINKKLNTPKLLEWYESSKLEQSKIYLEINVPLEKKRIFLRNYTFSKVTYHLLGIYKKLMFLQYLILLIKNIY